MRVFGTNRGGMQPSSDIRNELSHWMRFNFHARPLWVERRRQRGDLGQARGAAVLGPNLCAVTALWKYHLFLAGKEAWPSDFLYLHSEETIGCHSEIPDQTAPVPAAGLTFLSWASCSGIGRRFAPISVFLLRKCYRTITGTHNVFTATTFAFYPLAWLFTWPSERYNQINLL